MLKATVRELAKPVAMKIVIKKDANQEMLMEEYQILRSITHPNIVKIYSIERLSNFLIMTMKLCKMSVSDY